MPENYNIEDILSEPISIRDSNGNSVAIPWSGGIVYSYPLISRGEYLSLGGFTAGEKGLDPLDHYAELSTRISTLRSFVNDGGSVTIGTTVYTRSTLVALEKKLSLMSSARDELFSALINVQPGHTSLMRLLNPKASPASRPNTILNKALDEVARVETESEKSANTFLMGPQDISLQIGYVTFGASELGPESIVFGDINQVELVSSIRSDTDVALKYPGGRGIMTIDLIFANTDQVNTKLRTILAMIKMAPIIPIGGKFINAALINQVTAKDAFNELKNVYANIRKSKGAQQAFDTALTLLGPKTQLSFSELKNVFQNEREALGVIRRHVENEYLRAEAAKTKTIEDEDIKTPDVNTLATADNTVPVTLAMVVESATVTTITAAPGALRLRLVLHRMSNAYLPPAGLSFVDSNGDYTFDIRKSILPRAVERIYLSKGRWSVDKEVGLVNNKWYIPVIGEGEYLAQAGPYSSKSEVGHTIYKPTNSSDGSPVLFRFATAEKPDIVYNYIPEDMVLRSVTWTYNNKIAAIPLEGQLYPTFQHMGMGSVTASFSFDTANINAVSKFATIKAAIDQQSTHETASSIFRREFVDVYNDVLNLSGFKRFIVSSVTTSTDPDNVDLYHIELDLISNEENIRDREVLTYVEGSRAKIGDINAFWWWVYAGLVIKFLQNSPLKSGTTQDGDYSNVLKALLTANGAIPGVTDFIAPLGANDVFPDQDNQSAFGTIGVSSQNSSHTQEEVDKIHKMVFGEIKSDGVYREGVLERNILKAAIIEVMKKGLSGSGLDYRDITDDYTNAHEVNDGTYGSFLAKVVQASIKSGASTNKFSDAKIRISSTETDDDPLEIDDILQGLIDRYSKKNATTTSWFIGQPGNSDDTVRWLEAILDSFDRSAPAEYPSDDPVSNKFTKVNGVSSSKLAWIPSPALWAEALYVIHNWRQLLNQNNETIYNRPASYYLSRGGQDGPAFFVTSDMAQMGDLLAAMVSDPQYQSAFPSFWKKRKANRETSLQDINVLGDKDASKKIYKVDPSIYDIRNNYIDMPLPRYSELFSEAGTLDKNALGRPIPTKVGGYEVWRKVAPTYLELGMRPDMFDSVTGIILTPATDTQPARISVKYPSLLTPRSFFDYVDPGFFYYKKSWLLDKYQEIIKGIDEGTEFGGSGDLHPLGDDPSSGFGLSAREKQRIKELGDNPDLIEPVKLDFSMTEVIDKTEAIESVGVTTIGPGKATTPEDIGKFVAYRVGKTINDSIRSNETTNVPVDLTKLALLTSNSIKRIPVIDNTGRRLGILVANPQKGFTGSKMYKVKITQSIVGEATKVANNRAQKEGDVYFVHIDSTATHPKHPLGISYQDSAGVLRYNMYDGKSAAALFKSTIHQAGDLKANHVRAYPTFRLFFVREAVVGDSLVQYLEDDMYGYSSVLSIDLTLDKEDASTAVVRLTDISGVLSTAQFESEVLRPGEGDVLRDKSGNTSITAFGDDRYDTENLASKIKLEIGTNIVIKMGYGNDPDSLATVFTGAIAEIEPGPITTIVAQSYKTELFRHVNFYSSTDFFSGLLDTFIMGRNVTSTVSAGNKTSTLISPNYIILKILSKLAEVPSLTKKDQYSGLPHFGRFISLAHYRSLGQNAKLEYTNKWMSGRDTDNSIITSIAKSTFGLRSGLAALFTPISNGIGYINSYSKNYLHTNAMRNVYWGEDAGDSFLDSLTAEWIVNTDGWNALKEITRYKVGYICQEVPYGNRATLFIGRPDQLYHYKPVPYDTLNAYAAALPVIDSAVYAITYWSILSKFFKSKYFGAINDATSWKQYLIESGLLESNVGVGVRLYNKPLADSLDDYTKTLLDKINKLYEIEGSGAFNITEKIAELRDIQLLPSFAIARYVINFIKASLPKDIKTSNVEDRINRVSFKDVVYSLRDDAEILYRGSREDGIIYILGTPVPKGLEDGTIDSNEEIDFNLDRLASTSIRARSYPAINTEWIVDPNGGGYTPGEYIAVTLGGRILSANELVNIYKISPKSGLPTDFDASQVSRNPGQIAVASEFSYGVISEYHGSIRLQNAVNRREYAQAISFNSKIFMLLLDDRSHDLNKILSHSNALLKLAFATFFGIGFRENDVTDPSSPLYGQRSSSASIQLPAAVENVWLEYTKAVMMGVSYINRNNSDPSIFDNADRAASKFYSLLADTKDGVLGQLLSPDLITYGSLKSSSRPVDANTIRESSSAFNSKLRDMLIKGQITEDQLEEYQDRFRQLFALAQLGGLSANIANNNGDIGSTLSEIEKHVFSNNIPKSDAINSLDQILAGAMAKSEQAQLAKVDLNTTDYNDGPIAKGNNNDPFRSVLLANADDYKMFLTFFSKWLSNEGSALKDTMPGRTLEAINSISDSYAPPGVKRFADVHYIMSGYDIVENAIVASMSEMANNILLMTVKDIQVSSANPDSAGEEAVWSVDEQDTDYIPYPNYQWSGVDYHPFVKPELRKQRIVKEGNAETDIQRAALLITHMAEAIRPMYRGHLTIIGRNIKPYDRVVLIDANKDMFGMFEVEHVNHSMSAEGGWVTTIVPCALVHPVDAISDVVSKFDTSNIDLIFLGLNAFEWFLDACTIVGLIGAIFTGGTSAVGAIGAQTVKETAASAGKKFISNAVAGGMKAILRRALTSSSGKITKELEKRLAAKGTATAARLETAKKLAQRIIERQVQDTGAKYSAAFLGGAGAALGFAFSRQATIYGLGFAASGATRKGLNLYANVYTQMQMQSATLPINVFTLTRFGKPFQAGLDMDITRFYTFTERFGMGLDSIYRNATQFISESFKIHKEDYAGSSTILDLVKDYGR